MYTIVSINTTNKGSTGTIVKKLAEIAHENGYKYIQAYGIYKDNPKPVGDDIGIGTHFTRWFSAKLAVLTDLHGCFSIVSTILFLNKLRHIKPDVIHLHNIHGNYINIFLLFAYIKRNRIKVVWTLHDCWSFTGHCPHFTMIGCSKWKTGCGRCPQYKDFPKSMIDLSSLMWKLKKRTFNGIQDMVIITPSKWLQGLVQKSYLRGYPVEVIHNGIDLNVFRPTISDYREQILNGGARYIVLGVSMGWSNRKGFDVFLKLRNMLSHEYQILLVGTDEEIEKKLPKGILSIHELSDQVELAKLYSACDVFLNPTREDTYPTVNLEAIACGLPIVTFHTGGSTEIVGSDNGIVVNDGDWSALVCAIHEICHSREKYQNAVLQSRMELDAHKCFKKYIGIYRMILEGRYYGR